MPIFQDDLGGGQGTPPTEPTISTLSSSPLDGNVVARKLSEESIRTELCEGPLLDGPGYSQASPPPSSRRNFGFPGHETSDRELFIERLKKEKNKGWWPSREVR
jgi:hypothetical protein